MAARTLQLVLHYDGAGFAGWQRQRSDRTVQGVVEDALARLCAAPVKVTGAGRTDAGVHATGQAAGVQVPEKWTPASLRRALNAVLPADCWVAAAFDMRPGFHARYGATARRYRYLVGTDEQARSPFRRRWELAVVQPIDVRRLREEAAALPGEHGFRAFAVRGTAPEDDHHRCIIREAAWLEREGGLAFVVEANRFLHHMVRFLVGTMLEVGTGRRPAGTIARLLDADDNRAVAAPAAAHALYLERVVYPSDLYLESPESISA
jgi:tRNA pseudouridine38-40 synthase